MTTREAATVFADRARDLCAQAERPVEPLALLVALTALRLAALRLPPDEAEGSVADVPVSAVSVSSELPFDLYGHVLDPHDLPEGVPSAGLGSLVDDLGDICADLHEGLALYDRGDVAAATEAWRWSFWAHWGPHAIGAEAALHAWVARSALFGETTRSG